MSIFFKSLWHNQFHNTVLEIFSRLILNFYNTENCFINQLSIRNFFLLLFVNHNDLKYLKNISKHFPSVCNSYYYLLN